MRRGLKKFMTCLLGMFFAVGSLAGCSPGGETPGETPETPGGPTETPAWETLPDVTPTAAGTAASLSATDALGRHFDAVASFDDSRQVGLFYFLWSDSAAGDLSEMTLTEQKTATAQYPVSSFYYWDEPLYGYYKSEDAWVIRRHLELFAAAGVDYLMFDATNGYIYEDVLDVFLPVALEMQQAGVNVPQLAFYTNADCARTVTSLYERYYDPSTENGQKYAPLWYRHADTDGANAEGKPWIAARRNAYGGDYDSCSQEIRDFFYVKDSQWPNEDMKDNGMPWMSWASAADGYRQYNHNGIMSVSIAQHTNGAFSDAVFEEDRSLNRGRGWTGASRTNDETLVDAGANFAEQWEYAISCEDVNNIFVTGWNEWIAQKQPQGNGRSSCYFVDLYDKEFSRDAEMTAGPDGYGDNFFLQIASYIRRFKGTGTAAAAPSFTVDMAGSAAQWSKAAGYLDPEGDTADRNCARALGGGSYTNTTGRNDIVEVRVTHDAQYLYFYILCAEPVSVYTPGDACWMNVLLGTGGSGWNGFDYVVNRSLTGAGGAVERLNADGSTEAVGTAQMRQEGNALWLRVSRADLGLAEGGFTLAFKVADNVTNCNDILDYYVNGDSAPLGRLSHTYTAG